MKVYGFTMEGPMKIGIAEGIPSLKICEVKMTDLCKVTFLINANLDCSICKSSAVLQNQLHSQATVHTKCMLRIQQGTSTFLHQRTEKVLVHNKCILAYMNTCQPIQFHHVN